LNFINTIFLVFLKINLIKKQHIDILLRFYFNFTKNLWLL